MCKKALQRKRRSGGDWTGVTQSEGGPVPRRLLYPIDRSTPKATPFHYAATGSPAPCIDFH